MKEQDDCLVEIHTEELPSIGLFNLAQSFAQQVDTQLRAVKLMFADIVCFATPRRLAVLVCNLAIKQPNYTIERKGPALSAAFDLQQQPTAACIGFARSCGVDPAELITIQATNGAWVGFTQEIPGKSAIELLPACMEQAITALPIAKRMRWGQAEIEFARPVHAVTMLYGNEIVPATLLGCRTERLIYGHRFLAPDALTLSHAATYAALLATKGYVIADFITRRETIRQQTSTRIQETVGQHAHALMSTALLDEVTGLVEWPVALCGHFDAAFLALPSEVLISAMQDHQRYFPVVDHNNQLLPHFITICNIPSRDQQRVIHGNERVLRARLADAAFFYEADKKISLEQRIDSLKNIIFHAQLGTIYEKAERLSKLTAALAQRFGIETTHAQRAGWLAKTDLTTLMVGEFPTLQGIIGADYAGYAGEAENVAHALREQYLPRFASDELPATPLGQALAIADRIDTIVGAFGSEQIPTGDKDPYGVRRATLGVLRILIEKTWDIELTPILELAINYYDEKLQPKADSTSENTAKKTIIIPRILTFIQERLRAWYQEQGIAADIFTAVAAVSITNPLDLHQRIQAVCAFKQLSSATALSTANKRVSHLLAQYTEKCADAQTDNLAAAVIDSTHFEHPAEHALMQQLEEQYVSVERLCAEKQYTNALLQLATLHQPIDDFFTHVMIITDDRPRRINRLLLLTKLRALFLKVADIALLQ